MQILVPQAIFSQDTTKKEIKIPPVIRITSESEIRKSSGAYSSPDSVLTDIDLVNPPQRYLHQYLSVSGTASKPLIFSPSHSLITRAGIHSYDVYHTDADLVPVFRTNKRYTALKYHNSAFKEQAIYVMHSQNITKTWNAGFEFDRANVKDFMISSDTYRNKFMMFTSYQSPGDRYRLFAHVYWNTVKNDVNGGLVSDSIYLNTNVTNLGLKGLAVNLSEAANNDRRRRFYISQYYEPVKHDSGSANRLFISHSATLERKSFTYTDNETDSLFYNDFFFDTQGTYDSLYQDNLTNKISVIHNRGRNFHITGFAAFINTTYGQRSEERWNNMIAGGETGIRIDSALNTFAEASYVVSGHDQGNYDVNGSIAYRHGRYGRLTLSLGVNRSTPERIFELNESNHFIWKNDFDKISAQMAGLSYDLEKYHLHAGVLFHNLKGYIHLDEHARPVQHSSSISVTQFFLEKNFTFRHWHLDNYVVIQQTDNSDAIHLPRVINTHSLYFEKHLFNSALLLNTGLRLTSGASYFGDAFMPASGMFYLQNEIKTGGYPRTDLFVRFRIKSARIFLAMENILDNVGKDAYFLTPHYPQPGRVFKFGLSWKFYD